MSISYATRDFGTLRFSEPEPLLSARLPSHSGLYVLLVSDPSWRPRPFRAPYFGQSKDLDQRGFPFQHHAVQKWREQGGSIHSLWVAWYSTPLSAAFQREAIEDQLIERYKPELNERTNRASAMSATWTPYLDPSQSQALLGGLFGPNPLTASRPRPASTDGLGAFSNLRPYPLGALGATPVHTGISAFAPARGPGLLGGSSWWPPSEKPWWK
jgi:hypothetical protein